MNGGHRRTFWIITEVGISHRRGYTTGGRAGRMARMRNLKMRRKEEGGVSPTASTSTFPAALSASLKSRSVTVPGRPDSSGTYISQSSEGSIPKISGSSGLWKWLSGTIGGLTSLIRIG